MPEEGAARLAGFIRSASFAEQGAVAVKGIAPTEADQGVGPEAPGERQEGSVEEDDAALVVEDNGGVGAGVEDFSEVIEGGKHPGLPVRGSKVELTHVSPS